MAKRYNMSVEDVKKARVLAREAIQTGTTPALDFIIDYTPNSPSGEGIHSDVFTVDTEGAISTKPKITKEKVSENGDREVELISDRPLNRVDFESCSSGGPSGLSFGPAGAL